MRQVYCANCGFKISVIRKAIKHLNRIIEVIEPHKCSDEPVDIDLTPIDCPAFLRDDNKMIEKLETTFPSQDNKLNELNELKGFKDLRSLEDIKLKSAAPDFILDRFKSILMKGGNNG